MKRAKETETLKNDFPVFWQDCEGGLPRWEESEQEKGLEGEGCTGDLWLSKEEMKEGQADEGLVVFSGIVYL
jgi:hypothetical protein